MQSSYPFSMLAPPKISEKDIRASIRAHVNEDSDDSVNMLSIQSIFDNLNDNEKKKLKENISDIAYIHEIIYLLLKNEEIGAAGMLINTAIDLEIPGFSRKDIIKAVKAASEDKYPGLLIAKNFIRNAINNESCVLTGSDIVRIINMYFEKNRTEDGLKFAENAARVGITGIPAKELKKWITKGFENYQYDASYGLYYVVLKKRKRVIKEDDICSWVEFLLKINNPGTIIKLISTALEKNKNIRVSHISRWMDNLYKRICYHAFEKIAHIAVEHKVKGLRVSHIIKWIDQLFDCRKISEAGTLARLAVEKYPEKMRSKDIKRLINRFFENNDAFEAKELILTALKHNVKGIKGPEVKKWIDAFYALGKPKPYLAGIITLAGILRGFRKITIADMEKAVNTALKNNGSYGFAVYVIRNKYKYKGLTTEMVRSWITFCFEKGYYKSAGYIAAEAVTKKIPWITKGYIKRALQECIRNNDSENLIAIDDLCVGNNDLRLEPSYVAESIIKKCFDNGMTDTAVQMAIRAIFNNSATVDQVRNWVQICVEKDMFTDAAKIIHMAIKEKIPGISAQDVRGWINTLFRQVQKDTMLKIIKIALEKNIPVTADDLRTWADEFMQLNEVHEAGEVFVLGIEHNCDDITLRDAEKIFDIYFQDKEEVPHEDYEPKPEKRKIQPTVGSGDSELALCIIKHKSDWTSVYYITKLIQNYSDKKWYVPALEIAYETVVSEKEDVTFDTVVSWIQIIFKSLNDKKKKKGYLSDHEQSNVVELILKATEYDVKDITADKIDRSMRILLENGVHAEKVVLIAEYAINKNLPGITQRHMRSWINLFKKHGGLYAGRIAVLLVQRIRDNLLKTPEKKYMQAFLQAEKIFSDNDLWMAASNHIIRRLLMEMEHERFVYIIRMLHEFNEAFEVSNARLKKERQYYAEDVLHTYTGYAVILEVLLPGSIEHLSGLLRKGAHPSILIRFFESKKDVLIDKGMTEVVRGLKHRFEKAQESAKRKKKIDISSFYKILELMNSIMGINDGKEVLKCINSFDVSRPMQELKEELENLFIKMLARKLGIKRMKIKPGILKKIYLPFISRIFQNYEEIKLNNSHKIPRFRSFIKALFDDRGARAFMENTWQLDTIGREFAKHNKNIRNLLRKAGINVERHLGWEAEQRMPAHEFEYFEKSKIKDDPVQDSREVLERIKNVINTESLKDKHKTPILRYLAGIHIVPEYRSDSLTERAVIERFVYKKRNNGKKGDIIKMISNKDNLQFLSKLIGDISNRAYVKDNTSAFELMSDLKNTIYRMIERMNDDHYVKELKRLRKYFMIRPITRNFGYDMFLGDFTDCCLAMNSDSEGALIDRLIDEAFNIVEVIDQETGLPVACAWLYIDESGSLIVQNLEISADYNLIESLKEVIGIQMIEYIKKLTEYIGSKKLIIGQNNHGKFIGKGGLIDRLYEEQPVNILEKIGGYVGEKYYLDTSDTGKGYPVAEFSGNSITTDSKTNTNALLGSQ